MLHLDYIFTCSQLCLQHLLIDWITNDDTIKQICICQDDKSIKKQNQTEHFLMLYSNLCWNVWVFVLWTLELE